MGRRTELGASAPGHRIPIARNRPGSPNERDEGMEVKSKPPSRARLRTGGAVYKGPHVRAGSRDAAYGENAWQNSPKSPRSTSSSPSRSARSNSSGVQPAGGVLTSGPFRQAAKTA